MDMKFERRAILSIEREIRFLTRVFARIRFRKIEKFWETKKFSTVMKNDEISFESVPFYGIEMPCGG